MLRDDFHSDSDIDIIVDFERNSRYSLFDLVAMENELKAIFNRDVDLVTHKGIANSRNYLRRENILNSVIRRLLIIGEASNRISETTQQSLVTIPWRLIKGMRNRLVHEYDDIDLDTVWETVKTSLPILVVELENIVSSD